MFSRHKTSFLETVTVAAVTWTACVLIVKWIKAKRVVRGLSSCPRTGAVTPVQPFQLSALAMGSVYPFKGQVGHLFAKFSLYKKYGSTCIVSATLWNATPTYWFADADAVKAITSDRFTFIKDVEAYDGLHFYGPSIVGIEGLDWKRHRAITMNAFNEANNALVWRESVRTVNIWFTKIDALPPDHSVDLLQDLTRATLLIIGSAGFGRQTPWVEDETSVLNHKVTLTLAVTQAVAQVIPRAMTPKLIWNAVTQKNMYIPLIGPAIKKAQDAFEVLRGHMVELASEARNALIDHEKKNGKGAALLKNLVLANMGTYDQGNESDYKRLTDDELFSNMFVFYLAGHETTAHALCFAFLYLALYPECQQNVLEEVLKMYPDCEPTESPTPSYKEIISRLEYTSAVLHETLRLRPPVIRLGKLVDRDTTLKTKRFSTSPEGTIKITKEVEVPIEKGGICIIDAHALHLNPIHWGDDAEEFKPKRFIDTPDYRWPRDAFIAFSGGPRSCIGQRFAVVESVCIIASVVRRYEINLPRDVLGMKFEDQKRILLDWRPGVTISPTNARVRFRRRK